MKNAIFWAQRNSTIGRCGNLQSKCPAKSCSKQNKEQQGRQNKYKKERKGSVVQVNYGKTSETLCRRQYLKITVQATEKCAVLSIWIYLGRSTVQTSRMLEIFVKAGDNVRNVGVTCIQRCRVVQCKPIYVLMICIYAYKTWKLEQKWGNKKWKQQRWPSEKKKQYFVDKQ